MSKVLQVITKKPGYDGITISVTRFTEHMSKVQCDFAFIAEPPAELRARIEAMGARVFVLPLRLKRPVSYLNALRRLVKRDGYQVVHAHGNSCTLAIELLAAKLGGAQVRAAHSHNTSCKFMALHRILRPAFDRLYTHAWACGREAGEWLFPGKEFSVARVSVECEKFAYDPALREKYRGELGFTDEFVIGCVANFNEQKNHAFLIKAFREYHALDRSARLLLVGDGPLRGDIEAQIAEAGLAEAVVLTGIRSDVAGLIMACDAMALTSLHEGFPVVLCEWQCAGLRVLVSNRVTADTDLTGLLKYLPIDSPEKWIQALLALPRDDDRAEASAEAIRMMREKGYDIAENARELERFYAGE